MQSLMSNAEVQSKMLAASALRGALVAGADYRA